MIYDSSGTNALSSIPAFIQPHTEKQVELDVNNYKIQFGLRVYSRDTNTKSVFLPRPRIMSVPTHVIDWRHSMIQHRGNFVLPGLVRAWPLFSSTGVSGRCGGW